MSLRRSLDNAVSTYHDTAYAEVQDIVSSCSLKITWWGARRVTSTKYAGHISLDRLVDQVMRLTQNNRDFPETDRPIGASNYKQIDAMAVQCFDHENHISTMRWLFELVVWFPGRIFTRYHVTNRPTAVWISAYEMQRFVFYTRQQYMNTHHGQAPVGNCEKIGPSKLPQYDDGEYWR